MACLVKLGAFRGFSDNAVDFGLICDESALKLSSYSGDNGVRTDPAFPVDGPARRLTRLSVAWDDFGGGSEVMAWFRATLYVLRHLLLLRVKRVLITRFVTDPA